MSSFVLLRDVDRHDTGCTEEKSAGGKVPDPGDGPAEEKGAKGPDPRCAERDLRAKRAAAQGVDDNAGGGGDEALDAEHYKRGCYGIDSEEAEHQGNQIRIDRSDPCSGPGIFEERRTETLPARYVLSDAANLRAKREE